MDASKSYKNPRTTEPQTCFPRPLKQHLRISRLNPPSLGDDPELLNAILHNRRSKLLLITSERSHPSTLGNCSPRKSSKCSKKLRSLFSLPSQSVGTKRPCLTVQLGNCAARQRDLGLRSSLCFNPLETAQSGLARGFLYWTV